MAIKNYTTKVSANRSIAEIQDSLVKNGAIGMQMMYEKGTGRISALQFVLEIEEQKVPFSLPIEWRSFQEVLKQNGVSRYKDEDYCYRVAWRCIRDWVLAQMALYETQMVELPQVFLPFATSKDGGTLYSQISSGGFLLGAGE